MIEGEWMNEWIDGCMGERMVDIWMDEWRDG
jgi:hypothetical protein